MTDRLPGSSGDNPIEYRGWHIALVGDGCERFPWVAAHAEYNEMHHSDERIGYFASVNAAKEFVDRWIEEEAAPDSEITHAQ